MSNTDRIAEILREHHFVTELQLDGARLYHCEKCCGTKVCLAHTIDEYRDHLAELIDAELHPVIETVEQLDALPVRSVVRDADGDIHEQDDCGYWRCPRYPSVLNTVVLPARVLYTPEADR